jgi:monofunctional glycosyltransferase
LQLYFLVRVALMVWVDPRSTTYQRSEAWRLLTEKSEPAWSQRWVNYDAISDSLKRAVIASEDAGFSEHSGVEWDAIEKAWERNLSAEARAEKANQRRRAGKIEAPKSAAQAKLIGGSTITQQLAKNLFLGGERNLARKGQEFIITLMLETVLSKQRILEIYLNSVEWGEGLFGAEAAAQYYFRTSAANLGPMQAAQLSVMLPAPKRFEKRPASPYVMSRAGMVMARMGAVEVP